MYVKPWDKVLRGDPVKRGKEKRTSDVNPGLCCTAVFPGNAVPGG